MSQNKDFKNLLKSELSKFTANQAVKFSEKDILKIDLHCHDHNSDVPDELLGRILNVPETWLKTDRLVSELKRNGTDLITITNHNNARSCFELKAKGVDVLVGAEFSCTVPDFNIGIHVLTYGFDQEQELKLNKLRKNIYSFLEYTRKENIPTVWAHPLYYYSTIGVPPLDFFMKMSLIFERFEMINGQRDIWQNMLVKEWVESLTPVILDEYAKKFDIKITDYCRNPYKKSFTGGSDSHIGLFAGNTGTILHIPDLIEKSRNSSLSELALEAIRAGEVAPYGTSSTNEKLTVSLLDYVFQIAINRKDPGLMRILLHKGTTQDKILALLVSNAFAEIQRHKTTMRFINLFHNCFMGKSPSFSKKWLVPKAYKPIFKDATRLAHFHDENSGDLSESYYQSITEINHKLNKILYSRLENKLIDLTKQNKLNSLNFNQIIESLEISSELRSLLGSTKNSSEKGAVTFNLPKFLDGLSFPFLASTLILAANFTGTKVLYNTRPLLNQFSKHLGKFEHPRRMLWLTDTFGDNNGVAIVLKSILKEIQAKDLPIDLLVCSKNVEPEDHLLVIEPELEFTLPFYQQQPQRFPDFLKIHQIFQEGAYDRVMCSTEGAMGLAAIYLKNAFSVKANFYIHTDWVMFARTVLDLDKPNINRIRRLARAYYHNFDGLFVLNTDQKKWLTGKHIGFETNKVHLTAHWVEDEFKPINTSKNDAFGLQESDFVILFSGRVSKEKGVMELPNIYNQLIGDFPELKMVVAGSGPSLEQLRKQLPEAIYLGWVSHENLPSIYSAADLLVLPSKFDTFSCSVLESISCGLPVVAYNTKGPKDIIKNGENGFLANNLEDLKSMIRLYISDPSLREEFKEKAVKRALEYKKELIVNDLLRNVGLGEG